MSTRSIVALVDGDGFKDGVYVHSDGYPTGRGPTLYRLAEKLGGFPALWDRLKQHGGWSSLEWEGFEEFWAEQQKNPHGAYRDNLHFTRDPGVGIFYGDEPNLALWNWHGEELDTDCEWAYALDLDRETVAVFRLDYVEGAKHFNKNPVLVGVARSINDDWERLECGPNYEWCCHIASYHFEVPEASARLSTDTWLGRSPLDLNDAVGWRIKGVEYKATGSGHRGGYGPYSGNKNHWYATVQDANGKYHDFAVWSDAGKKKHLLAGVEPIYPPIGTDLEVINASQ